MRISRPRARQLAKLSARDVACPLCGSAAAEVCRRLPARTPMMGFHLARWRAVEALRTRLRQLWTAESFL